MKILSYTFELTFDDVLLLPGKSDFEIDDDKKKTSLRTKLTKKIILDNPLISAPMPQVTETHMAISLAEAGGMGFIHCFQPFDRQLSQVAKVAKKNLKVAASISDLTEKGIKHVGKLLKAGVTLVGVETGHVHNVQAIRFIKALKNKYKGIQISAALVVTGIATEELIKAGADNIRVGIGGGSHCTTRLTTGVGRPQLSAVKECFEVAKKYQVPVMSDTGIKNTGDIAKALVFGADTVMIGGMFAGTDECPGEIITKKGKKYKYSYGMCTDEAMLRDQKRQPFTKESLKKTIKDKAKSLTRYRSQKENKFQEGVGGLVEYKGSINLILENLSSGVQRSMWYLGARKIEELRKRAKVVIISPNTRLEPRIKHLE